MVLLLELVTLIGRLVRLWQYTASPVSSDHFFALQICHYSYCCHVRIVDVLYAIFERSHF